MGDQERGAAPGGVLLDRLFASEALTPQVSCEGDEPGASQDMISAGLGIRLIPAMSRRLGTDTRVPVAWVRVNAPDCHRVLTLVWNRDAYLSEAALKFRKFVTDRPFLTHRLAAPGRRECDDRL